MAFDQSTRNRLQKFVNDARNLLTEEFTRQLQATYGLDPKAGSVAAVSSLTHLDNRQRQTANVLRDTLAHYLATTHGKGEKDRTKQALSRIVREQAFTVLNRLAALRMAEARGFLLETIAKGYNAKGFQLYKQLAGSSLGETGEAYRNYLYSVFDEFSLDLAVLFDRHSAQGRLFPRESALLELLELINHHEIEPLWAEDETIGWIYQYFNSQEERKKMRAESQAPRNSRELAVRNQFFTPRYVVEFLTDNTLGRIWYEMTQGKTSLIDSCRYLVRRPTEVFLKPGEPAPEQEKAAGEAEALSQEELLKQPVYIPHRAIKDPRCI
ncbi:MAG: SAM-dependent methyltransferase, partial [Anaerolineae bacterium]|nr:SAM-dependent methyltransferase [Anaerolineae bacterium]